MDKIILIGGGGHCKVIIDIIKSTEEYKIYGIIDKDRLGKSILDIPIIGTDDDLQYIFKRGINNAFIALGAIDNLMLRNKIYLNLKNIGYNVPKLIHKKAIISPYAKVNEGTCVMPGAVINAGACIEENCVINTSSVIEHDCLIKSNTHISPGALIAGGIVIGENCHIGLGSSIIQGVTIGDNVIIGAGAVVINDIKDNVTAVGIPAKIIKSR